jgi:hypothetical protein
VKAIQRSVQGCPHVVVVKVRDLGYDPR